MRILAIISGEYGRRHVENVVLHQPGYWTIETWQSPTFFPMMIDYPEDFLPASFAAADLILSFAEHKGVAELLPDIARMTGARGVVVAVDNAAWLPMGLARQLGGWLAAQGVAFAAPKPLCSLTERDYGVTRRERAAYQSAEISEFARFFGQPRLRISVDPATRVISAVETERDAVCGCARYVAQNLVGINVDDAEEKAGLIHHHFPCLASMEKLAEFNHDTLMHASGHLLRDNVAEQIKPFKQTRYFRPG